MSVDGAEIEEVEEQYQQKAQGPEYYREDQLPTLVGLQVIIKHRSEGRCLQRYDFGTCIFKRNSNLIVVNILQFSHRIFGCVGIGSSEMSLHNLYDGINFSEDQIPQLQVCLIRTFVELFGLYSYFYAVCWGGVTGNHPVDEEVHVGKGLSENSDLFHEFDVVD